MKLTGYLGQGPVRTIAQNVSWAEDVGLDRLWTSELAHDPFLPLALVADRSDVLSIGTSLAISFARTPWATAQVAWDLHQMSGQRFVLGLGTQVRAHVERRFGGRWESPVGYTRDYVGALRAIWRHWTDGGPLAFESETFNLDLTAPIFQAEAGGAAPPVYLGGVNRQMCRLAGRIADGFLVHGFGSPTYVRDHVIPELVRDRDRDSISVVIPVLMGTSADPSGLDAARERARQQVAFYASTPAYRPVLEVHGWESLGEKLSALARERQWSTMTALVDDEVLDTYAVCGPPEDVGREMVRRFEGLADEVAVLQSLDELGPECYRRIRAGFDRAATTVG
ncbi:TIGR03617 family F420-dependent LLM class oxidoreductase [Georgenia sp. SYP-B2076]|uniref:TIGR03617 family F420-dependent LLM class oxidoreductase n=1 Tax=Georgenia sp. SYP-B2076 TaxID=2495881 RepID=UPI0013DEC64D|nr:TIGR03617 family F420-dependent LLM class oxidoreductase [Georgenia sp. SYP-B2076]